MGKVLETAGAIQERKAERVEKGREAIGDIDWAKSDHYKGKAGLVAERFAPGDIVAIKYSNATKDEELLEINIATGKIAIKQRYNKTGKRWLPATLVTAVKSQQQALPFSLTAEHMEKMAGAKDGAGFVQFRFGAEFIERSYVVSDTRAGARLGNNYECASTVVYQDPVSKLFWRATGSFD
jgi:hypothetical protein